MPAPVASVTSVAIVITWVGLLCLAIAAFKVWTPLGFVFVGLLLCGLGYTVAEDAKKKAAKNAGEAKS